MDGSTLCSRVGIFHMASVIGSGMMDGRRLSAAHSSLPPPTTPPTHPPAHPSQPPTDYIHHQVTRPPTHPLTPPPPKTLNPPTGPSRDAPTIKTFDGRPIMYFHARASQHYYLPNPYITCDSSEHAYSISARFVLNRTHHRSPQTDDLSILEISTYYVCNVAKDKSSNLKWTVNFW